MVKFIVEYWLQILFTIIVTLVATMYKKFVSYKAKLDSTRRGIKALLKSKISEFYIKIMDKGSITFYEKETINEMYNEYKNLGGNGVVENMVKELNELEMSVNK